MIEYAESVDGVEARHLEGFFVGWQQPPSPDRHLELLRESDHVVLARAEYQGRGIGSELMRRLLARLEHLYMVDLCCDADLEPFYRRLGLQTWDRGMGIRNREALRR